MSNDRKTPDANRFAPVDSPRKVPEPPATLPRTDPKPVEAPVAPAREAQAHDAPAVLLGIGETKDQRRAREARGRTPDAPATQTQDGKPKG